jgi:hypothetical protein
MQQWIEPDVRVEVTLVVEENLDVGAEDGCCFESVEGEFGLVFLGVFDGDDEGEYEDEEEGGVNSLDSAAVKVHVGKVVFECLLDDDLGDEVARDDKENINSNEPSRQGFGPGMINDDQCNGDSPEPVNIRTI